MSHFHNTALIGAAGQSGGAAAAYQIDRSLRFNTADTSNLERTPSSAGDRRTLTMSFWIKLTGGGTYGVNSVLEAGLSGSGSTQSGFSIRFDANQKLQIFEQNNNSITWQLQTSAVYRDYGSWYSVVIALDTTQSTAADRVKIWVNGEQVTSFSTASYPSQNYESNINKALPHRIGASDSGGSPYLPMSAYLADVHFIDGQALAPTDFGEYDSVNVWQPKEPSFTSPNNGTTWSSNVSASTGSIVDAALAFNGSTSSGDAYATSTASDTYIYIDFSSSLSGAFKLWTGMSSGSPTATVTHGGGTTVVSLSSGENTLGTFTAVTRIAVNRGEAATHSFRAISVDGVVLIDGAGKYGVNGFNLDFSDNSSDQALGYDAAVTQPTLNPRGGMDVITYTGNGSTQTIGGLAFQPDFLWIKSRTGSNKYHTIADSVRGKGSNGAYLRLFSNTTSAELNDGYDVTDITSDGFSLTNGSYSNTSSENYVAWAWKAGGPAVLNEDGSIDSQVSVSTDYGFSIVSWEGNGSSSATVGHGLSSTPKWVIVKGRETTDSWSVHHTSLTSGHVLLLNSTGASFSASTAGGGGVGAPTSSTLTFINGTSSVNNVNQSTKDFIAYCWSEVSGFSKFGSYTGNGSTNGPTITTGFKPRYILIKADIAGEDWVIMDTARDSVNPVDQVIFANTADAEITNSAYNTEFQVDGFQLKNTNPRFNTSGETYIYAAFADRPGNNWTPNNLIAEAGLETASQGMDVVLYTGNGSTQSITGLDFQPDLVWMKPRNEVNEHVLVDVVRGAGYRLFSNQTNAENYQATSLTSFDSNGFSLGSHTSVNKSSIDYVAWCWKAGGTASSNTAGSITSSVSANTTYGFSIVSYTGNGSAGATIGHGLNAAPQMIFIKTRNTARNWTVGHQGIASDPWTDYLTLNSSAAAGDLNTVWNDTAPTSSVFTVGSANGVNANTETHIAYCWSEVPGFSRFGSWTGNGSTTGPVITTGFKVRFLLIKRTDSTANWRIIDTERGANELYPNLNNAEGAFDPVTYTNDGFQIKVTDPNYNASGGTYIYAAFAGKPPGEIIDSLIDTPTNYEASSGNNGGNYATLNPLAKHDYSAATLSNGNLDVSFPGGGGFMTTSTIAVSSGKWYYEETITSTLSNTSATLVRGLENFTTSNTAFSWRGNGGTQGLTGSPTLSTYTDGDVLGIAVDVDNTQVTFYKNGTVQGTGAYTYSTFGSNNLLFGAYSSGTANISFNFGQRPFAYTPPTGYKSLCTTNLTDPTIADGSTAMDVALYTGNSGTQTISGLDFSPDLLWIKSRSAAYSHRLFDTVRGVTKALYPDLTEAEGAAQGTNENLTAFTSDGFSLGSASGIDAINNNNVTFAGWAWDGGTTTATNTDGSITSNVRANASTGFSIVTWTGQSSGSATIGHGLNAAPELIILKGRTGSVGWTVGHESIGWTRRLQLNTTAALSTSSNYWNDTAPTNSVFTSGANNVSNTFVAYCFAPVAGYSAFGSYSGNGSTDGPFVFTGFRPRWILIKRIGAAASWVLHDTERSTYNVSGAELLPNDSGAEYTYTRLDFLSNGFKARTTEAASNTSGNTYVYAAFAEHPFKTARAR